MKAFNSRAEHFIIKSNDFSFLLSQFYITSHLYRDTTRRNSFWCDLRLLVKKVLLSRFFGLVDKVLLESLLENNEAGTLLLEDVLMLFLEQDTVLLESLLVKLSKNSAARRSSFVAVFLGIGHSSSASHSNAAAVIE